MLKDISCALSRSARLFCLLTIIVFGFVLSPRESAAHDGGAIVGAILGAATGAIIANGIINAQRHQPVYVARPRRSGAGHTAKKATEPNAQPEADPFAGVKHTTVRSVRD
jgi:hypothetical protein